MNIEPIVIVSGIPRSGTSLMMQMLHAGGVPVLTDGVRTSDADNPKGYWEYEPVKRLRESRDWLPGAGGHALKVIHLLVPSLSPELSYRFIFVRRNLDEVLASQNAMLRRMGRPVAANAERVRETLASQLEKAISWARSQPGSSVLEVEHRAIIESPEVIAVSVAAYVGALVTNPLAMGEVVDSQLYRNRR